MAKFKNPPIAEAWISFNFEPNEHKRRWDLELVREYVLKYSEEFPKFEVLTEQEIKIVETSPTELPKIVSRQQQIKAARAFTEDRSRVLQVRDDQISFHVLKSDGQYPGYQMVRDGAAQKLAEYLKVFQPIRIKAAALHYVDIIEIPKKPDESKLDLSDYFLISADVPETPFGLIGDLSARFLIVCPVDNGPLILEIKTLPSENNNFRFRLDWHKISKDIDSLNIEEVLKRLDSSHQYIMDCFLAGLTDRTLDLFLPIKED